MLVLESISDKLIFSVIDAISEFSSIVWDKLSATYLYKVFLLKPVLLGPNIKSSGLTNPQCSFPSGNMFYF